MAVKRKINNEYYFTVEGQTEKLYLKWLESELNNIQDYFHIVFNCNVEQRPLHYAKMLSTLTTTEIIHVCDIEGRREEDLKKFTSVLDQMKSVKQKKEINYILAYSNLDFELWMILHKMEANGSVSDKHQYLERINRSFGTAFESLDEYKEKDHFMYILKQLSINDVMSACKRAEKIMKSREMVSRPVQYKGYTYFLDNPSTSVYICIRNILKDAKILKDKRSDRQK